jgi:tetratricopeptide (TPR) repeat protein
MPEAIWVNERCYAMRLLGKAYDHLGEDGRDWFRKACKEAPNTREPWVELAESAYKRKDWQECYESAKQALTIKDKALVYTMNPEVWTAQPHDYLAISAFYLGNKEEAITHGKIALEFEPDNTRLKENLNYYLE